MKKILSFIVMILCLAFALTGCGTVDKVKSYYIEQEPVISFNEETNNMTVLLKAKTQSLTNVLKAKATRVRITFTSLKPKADGTYKSFTLSDVSLASESNIANAAYVTLLTPEEEDACGYPLTHEVDAQTVSTFTNNYYEGKYAMKFSVNLADALVEENAAFIKEEKFVKISVTLIKGYDIVNAKEESYAYLNTEGTYFTHVKEYKCTFKQGESSVTVRVYDGYSFNDLVGYNICDKDNVISATWYLFGKDEVTDIYNYRFTKDALADQAEFLFNGTKTYVEDTQLDVGGGE